FRVRLSRARAGAQGGGSGADGELLRSDFRSGAQRSALANVASGDGVRAMTSSPRHAIGGGVLLFGATLTPRELAAPALRFDGQPGAVAGRAERPARKREKARHRFLLAHDSVTARLGAV